MNGEDTVITLLGSSGGVAKAVISIFNKAYMNENDPIHYFIKNSKLHLIDIKQKDKNYYENIAPNLKNNMLLHEIDLNHIPLFKKHLQETQTSIVVDVSWADTGEILRCCNELGVKYIDTALENTFIDENETLFSGFQLMERFSIFDEMKPSFKNTSAIIGSGMNPGVVQWMAIDLMNQYSDEKPLACYIVEHDTSFYENPNLAKKNTVYTTWSPECFLEEAISSYPMFMTQQTPVFLFHDVYSVEFKVTLGEKVFYGSLMPHEEVYTLGSLFNLESGFLYRVNENTTNLIRDNLEEVDVIWDFDQMLLDPSYAPLIGEDLVGVLLVYEDKERFVYNVMNNKDAYANYGTNATYLQVACGIYAGVASLLLDSFKKGVYYVDELLLNTDSKYGTYLKFHMPHFVYGQNEKSDGLLLQRMKPYKDDDF
ncbi:S-adenosylmethionine decarboxylase related protein [Bacillus sp. AFS053548]|uniref:S-adenosylmethionine decarboxylase related protein n=1 Tax=Bacillus sp. AFS053548 TaxID=2033505 RepID=UPI000BFDC711|nr:S-adenosylmethionine decarboxylase related protein [Bacillus sp. AFS053548]PGM56963.1 S-adenosylmethionine decarboxylase related protein [Bacillus sp. AFS053548]